MLTAADCQTMNYYQALNIDKNASIDEIISAYKKAVFIYHPDRNPSPDAGEVTRFLNNARDVLTNIDSRAVYDIEVSLGGREPERSCWHKSRYDTWMELAADVEPNMDEFFPRTTRIKEPREIQVDAIKQLVDLVKSGKNRIVLCGPPGCGKSAIGLWFANLMNCKGAGGKVTYTSPLNTLVDQFDASFSETGVVTLKGREHYRCMASYKAGLKVKASEAPCRYHRCIIQGSNVPRIGEGKPTSSRMAVSYRERDCKGCNLDCPCNDCEYRRAAYEYGRSRVGNTNFTLHQLGVFRKDARVYVIDECEMAESFIRMFRGITLNERWNAKLPWETQLAMIVETIADKKEELDMLKKTQAKNSAFDEFLAKKIEDLDEDIKKLGFISDDFAEHKEPWVAIPMESSDRKGNKKYAIRFEPITVQRFIDRMFEQGDIVLFMSATPDQEPDIELDCPFPKENRPWTYYPVGKMSWQHRKNTIPKLAEFIIKLDKVRSGKKLVHCGSYDLARAIAIELELYNRKKTGHMVYFTLQVPGSSVKDADGIEQVTRNHAVSNFVNSGNRNQVLLSVNMWSGLDLAGDEFTTQIIAKIPFVNPKDPVIQAKMAYMLDAEKLIDREVANMVMQGYGRINRNSTKKTLTIITDESWGWFYTRRKRLFRKYFREAEVKKAALELEPVAVRV